MKQIESLLRERIGLDPGSIGATTIRRNVRLRINALGLPDVSAYRAMLAQSAGEWRELTESLVVAETWFYRDRKAFDAAERLAREEWLDAHSTGVLNVLSLPCSTGEEPYSLAMTLLDAGLSPARFWIDAVDLSERAIDRARRAIYGPNSFRGKELGFRDQHFRHSREGYVLERRVRDCVHFRHGNLLDRKFRPGRPAYDCIFCRNLLIYFDRPTRQVALHRLGGLLKPNGVLFTGAAEVPLVEEHGFVSAGIPMAFACRKREVGEMEAKSDGATRSRGTPPPKAVPETLLLTGTVAKPGHLANTQGGGSDSDLVLAKRLVDGGRLVEATAICEDRIRRSRTCAQAYYLLGLIKDSTGNADAGEYYRKALYLQPGHYESLMRMAALAEKTGRQEQSRIFQRRAHRVTRSQAPQP